MEIHNGRRVALDTLGCKLNQAETESLIHRFAGAGYKLVPASEMADVYILNTCTVTHIADRKARNWLRRARRQNPGALVVGAGCYAKRAPQEISAIGGIDLVVGNEKKEQLVEMVEKVLGQRLPVQMTSCHSSGLRTRAFIKVQDGCNRFCSYCIVPLVRGREKSVPSGQVTAEIKKRVGEGYKEVVLTGTEIGSYSYSNINLEGLLELILSECPPERLRLSSLQPEEVSPELIRLWQDPRLCRHFHLPLQSGSDSVLSRMGRRYSTGKFADAVSLVRSVVPDTAITTDVIVGFPGETDNEFRETYEFCRNLDFARIHVFPYSRREGTTASCLPDQISENAKRERSRKMLALSEESSLRFCKRFPGTTVNVLWEKQSRGMWSGLTDNYVKVYAKSGDNLENLLLPVEITGTWQDGVEGKIVR